MKQIILVFGLFILGLTSYSQTARVVGYLPTYRFSSSSQIEYCKLTHLNLAFANPDSTGKIIMQDIGSVMSDALSDNPDIVICISMAGGQLLTAQQAEDWSKLIDIPSNRPAFIANIVEYVLANELDGVDVDLEWGHVTSGYSDFVIELETALNPHNKIVTAAFPNQTLFSNVSKAALSVLDFINIMSYDATGPWSPGSPGQHSSFEFSTSGINFWKNTVGISGDSLNLGVPFYGYDFVDASTVNAFTFASMVSSDESYADLDHVGTAYYNGRPTIEAKVDLAKHETGGIMIWEVGQDSFDEFSLLKSIHDKYTALEVLTTGLCGNDVSVATIEPAVGDVFRIYPNPAHNLLRFETSSRLDPDAQLFMYGSTGKLLQSATVADLKNRLKINHLSPGVYLMVIKDGERIYFQRFMKV